MKLASYWTDTAPAFVAPPAALPGRAEVVIVGGGFTACRRHWPWRARARGSRCSRPARWRMRPSGRNGGHVNNGLGGLRPAGESCGSERPALVPHLPTRQSIPWPGWWTRRRSSAASERQRQAQLAASPAHYTHWPAQWNGCAATSTPTWNSSGAAQVRAEIQCDRFHGGLLQKTQRAEHMGRFALGWRRLRRGMALTFTL